ncbi:adenosine deaminase [Candidatus Woesebacteria bacterium]|nr:adenosine deaminase [Candidatus Woesebacteria bacterium]
MDITPLLSNLAELHAHVGSSIAPHVLWHIANAEGYKLPKRDYHEFSNYVVLTQKRKMTLKEYLDEIYHPILDKLSSGTRALEKAVYETFSGAYRGGITLYELRGNPMKHNKEGEVDLDHAILAMLHGMERSLLEYPKLRAGIIFCLDRQFNLKQNTVIVEKAIKYAHRGVIGIDFSNYNKNGFHYKDYAALVKKARNHGLHVTAHTGETVDTNDMWECIESIAPERIGHGIKAAYDTDLMKEIAKRNIVLEVCPLSNLVTKAVKNIDEMKHIFSQFERYGVQFTINTDWPETIEGGHLDEQFIFLYEHGLLNKEQIKKAIQTAFQATFVPNERKTNLYL